MLDPAIKILTTKQLVGKKITMSFTENKTGELWRAFMPLRKSISNQVSHDLFSLQVYPANYFEKFNPQLPFEKWALTEVKEVEHLPEGMEAFILPGGLYAVFQHRGTDTSIFTRIFTEWLPSSGYQLDERPHFELLGENYKNGDPASEEEIWIPIRTLN